MVENIFHIMLIIKSLYSHSVGYIMYVPFFTTLTHVFVVILGNLIHKMNDNLRV